MTNIDSSFLGEFISCDASAPYSSCAKFDVQIETNDAWVNPEFVKHHIADPKNRLTIELELLNVRNGVPGYYKLTPLQAAVLKLPPVDIYELMDAASTEEESYRWS